MTRTAPIALAIAAASALALPAGCEDARYPCPRLESATREADTSALDWTLSSASSEVVATTAALDPSACRVWVEGPGTADKDTGRNWLVEWVYARCATPAGGIQVDFLLPDPRAWTKGERAVATDVRVQYQEPCADGTGAADCGTWCDAFVDGVILDVLEAAGGRADWPTVVSDDFRRVYAVRFATDGAVQGAGKAVCGRTFRGTLTARFALAAADVQPDPDRTCDSFRTFGLRDTIAREFNEKLATAGDTSEAGTSADL